MKTILEWYDELPEPYRSQAIENYSGQFGATSSLEEAVKYGFYWDKSPQGHDYWDELHYRIFHGEPLNPTLEQTLKQSIKSLNELKTALDEVCKAIGNESN